MKKPPPTDRAAGKGSRELIIDQGMDPAAVAVSTPRPRGVEFDALGHLVPQDQR